MQTEKQDPPPKVVKQESAASLLLAVAVEPLWGPSQVQMDPRSSR